MADVCELAHRRTVGDCNKKNITVDCYNTSAVDHICHKHENDEIHYTTKAQIIFDKHYDYICEVTGI